MRRPLLSLAVVAFALTCSAVAVAGRGEPQRAITKADQAKAKAMLVTRADLAPGFLVQRRSADPDLYCAALDESDLTVTGDAESPMYTRQQPGSFLSVMSSATLYRTGAQALTSWRRGTSKAGEQCARTLIAKELAATGASLRRFQRVSFPKLAPLTIAYRLVLEVKGGEGVVPLYADVVALQQGRAQAAVTVFSLGAPLVRSELVVLARAVAQRMSKAVGG